MADQKHTVEVELIAKSKQFKKDLKKVVDSAKKMGQGQGQGQQGGQSRNKSSAQIKKEELKHSKDLLKNEKSLSKEINKATKVLEKRLDVQKKLAAATKEELKHAEKLAKATKEIKKGARRAPRRRKAGTGGTGGGTGGGAPRGPGGDFQDDNEELGNTIRKSLKRLGKVLGAGALAAGGGILGMAGKAASEGYARYSQYGQAMGGLIGMGGSRGELERARGQAARLGYTGQETAQQAKQIGRATGNIGAVTQAQQTARLTGMDVGEVGGFMGTLTQAGQGFGGKAGGGGKKELVKVLSEGFESGLDRARMPEFIKSVGSLVERQAGRAGGDVSAGGYAEIMRAMGKSGEAGLQGERGGALLSQMDQAIRRPGGGEQGQSMMLRAFGFGGPGGDTSYYDALKRQQKGASDPQNLIDMFKQTEKEFGGGEQQILALNKMTGASIDQLEKLREVVDSNMDSDEKMEKIKDIQDASKTLEEKSYDQMKEGFGDMVSHLAKVDSNLIDVGNELKEPIQQMQELLQEMIKDFLPAMKIALETIADVATKIYEFISGKTFGADKEKREEAVAAAVGKSKDLRKQLKSGEISKEEYQRKMSETSKSAREQTEEVEGNYFDQVIDFYNPFSKGNDRQTERKNTAQKMRVQRAPMLLGQENALGDDKIKAVEELLSQDKKAAYFVSQKVKEYDKQKEFEKQGRYKEKGIDYQGDENVIKELAAMFAPGGEYHSHLMKLMEQNQKTAGEVEKMSMAQNEGPASAFRKTGGKEPTTANWGGVD